LDVVARETLPSICHAQIMATTLDGQAAKSCSEEDRIPLYRREAAQHAS
jgi:hypothetical protein